MFKAEYIPVITAIVTVFGGYIVAKMNGKKDRDVFLQEKIFQMFENAQKETKELKQEVRALAETNDILRLEIIALKENNSLLKNEVTKLTKENAKLRVDVIRFKEELSKRSTN